MSLLSVRENAKFWGFSESWIYRHWLELYGFKVGSRIKFDEEDQKELLSKYQGNSRKLLTAAPSLNINIQRRSQMASKSQARRNYGYGSVYKRKKGKSWTIDFYDENGRRIQQTIPQAACREEAVLALSQEITKIFDRTHGIEEHREEKIGFKTFAKVYLEDYMMTNRRNFKPDRYRLQTLCGYFKNVDLRAISPLDIERFRASRIKAGNSKSTTNRYLQLVGKMFNLAVEEGYLEDNVVKKVRCFSEKDNLKERVLTEDEERRLMDNCSDTLKPIIAVALNTGMRRAEILNLKWSQIDFEARRIKVEKTKGGKVRHIPINDDLNKHILKLKSENSQSPFVFFNPKTGKPFLDMKTPFKRACRISGIKGLRFHDLRHTFASRLIERGVDIETARDLLGHHSIVITQRYIHSNDDRKRAAVEILLKKSDKTGRDSDNLVTIQNQSELIS